MTAPDLTARTDALAEAADLAEGRLPDAAVEAARATVEQVGQRLGHGTDHTVVALAGPTGSGKSSLFNALVGTDAARVGVTRPTTGRTQAAVFGTHGAAGIDALLDWLEVRDRHLVGPGDGRLDGLVLLDLPDFDSTAVAHRVEVDRLVELVDLLVWVVEPQKYADEALHRDYLRRFSEHASVQRFVLTKQDLLDETDRTAVVADLEGRLLEDGLDDAVVWPVSTASGTGTDAVVAGLAAAVEGRDAAVRRLAADLRVAVSPLMDGAATEPTVVGRRDRQMLVEGLGDAAGVAVVADAVAHDHRQAARRAMGWPVTRWIRRRRPSRLSGRRLVDGADPVVEVAAVGAALRDTAEAVGGPLGPPWDAALRRETIVRRDVVAESLGGRVLRAAREATTAPRWWSVFAAVQLAALAASLVGLLWLVVLVILGTLRLSTDQLEPEVWGLPLPTLLLGGGVVAGWLCSLVARVPTAIAARRRARRARRRMQDVVEEVAADDVIAGIESVLAERARLAELATRATGAD